jgi:hypothetical protein
MKYAWLLFSFVSFACTLKTADNPEENISSDTATAFVEEGFNANDYQSFLELANYITTESPATDILEVVDSTCAIIVNPTDEQIKNMETEYGDDFATIADDNSFYHSEAYMKLDSSSIKTIATTHHFLRLQGDSETWVLDLRKEGAPEWNLIFFHKNKKPEVVSSIDVTYEKINDYFGN